jgi:hypothetical protein
LPVSLFRDIVSKLWALNWQEPTKETEHGT